MSKEPNTKTAKKLMPKDLKGMNLVGLLKYWNTDWKKEDPLLSVQSNQTVWNNALFNRSDEASALEILQALNEFNKESDEYVEAIDDLKDKFIEHFTYTMKEQIENLQTTVQILLDHHQHDNANITIGQYNRMKDGM